MKASKLQSGMFCGLEGCKTNKEKKKLWLTKLSSLFIVMPTCFPAPSVNTQYLPRTSSKAVCLLFTVTLLLFLIILDPIFFMSPFFFTTSTLHQSVKVSHKMQLVSLSHIYEDILPPCGHLFVTSVM